MKKPTPLIPVRLTDGLGGSSLQRKDTEVIEQPWGDERLKMNGAFIGCVTKQNADEIMRLQTSLNELARYFTSGNSVPVERATIKAADFWRITGKTPNAEVTGA